MDAVSLIDVCCSIFNMSGEIKCKVGRNLNSSTRCDSLLGIRRRKGVDQTCAYRTTSSISVGFRVSSPQPGAGNEHYGGLEADL